MKKWLLFILLSGTFSLVWGGNVKITSAPYIDLGSLKYNNMTTIYMEVEWENSWRDDHNWDAVYVFLKYKKSTDVDWSHVLLRDDFHKLTPGYTYFPARNPDGGAEKSVGLFIYRDAAGEGKASVSLELQWKYNMNGLKRQDLLDGISLEAMAIEMVYIPKGPFRPGDQQSKFTFQKEYRQILPEWDLLKPETFIYSGGWINTNPATMNPMLDNRGPEQVCDHDNDPRSSSYATSFWVSEMQKEASLTFDLGTEKEARYVAMELADNPVISWIVSGGRKKNNGIIWTQLGAFSKEQAPVNSIQAYPATRAIPLKKTGSFRYYKFDLQMENAGHYAQVRTISMTDKNLENLTEDAYIIDGPGSTIAFNSTLGLNAREGALSGNLNDNYAVGFEGFYVMKYEISQRQYVDFLNKLTVEEQKLRTIGEDLSMLEMGDYVYGAGNHKAPVCRNGIVVGALQDNRYAFACNLNSAGENNLYNEADDGMEIACNFLSPRDMLAYASWCGLRPLSELEYEKMGHQTIDSLSGKVPAFPVGGYAWGNVAIHAPGGNSISNAGKNSEKLSSANVNVGGKVAGPVRSGSFSYGNTPSAANSGASFYGVMELSGNLAEIYYRSEPGKELLYQGLSSHGKGLLTNGEVTAELRSYWGNPDATTLGQSLILRGGSFATGVTERARLADRGETNGYTNNNLNRKDSTVTFRLGHSVTAYQTAGNDYYPDTYLVSENGTEAAAGVTVYDTVCTGVGYTITGSDPVAEGMKPSGEVRYAWYCNNNNNGKWVLMEERNGKDLNLTAEELDHYSATYRTCSYKRRMYTPTQYSETGIVTLRIGTNRPFTRDKEEILRESNQINGVLVESAPAATFKWYADINGERKPLTAFYTTNVSSYMSVIRDSFPDAATGKLVCEVTTNELGCKKEVSVPFTVKKRPTSGTKSANFSVANCGKAVQDTRDGEIYTTVMMNDQCWMAENMRYKEDGSNTVGGYGYYYCPLDSRGTTYGICYYSHINVANVVCPEGWVLPSQRDMEKLLSFANNGGADEYGGYRLRAGNFWVTARDNATLYNNYIYAKEWNYGENPTGMQEGFNTFGFGLMGGGYNGSNPSSTPDYSRAVLMVRASSVWQIEWSLPWSNGNFGYWSTSNYYCPVRCILKSTSVD